jgi:hypothetical protein
VRRRTLAGVLLLAAAAAALLAPADGYRGLGPAWLMGGAALRACAA